MFGFEARHLADCHYKTRVQINWLPDETQSGINDTLNEHCRQHAKKQCGSRSPFHNYPDEFGHSF